MTASTTTITTTPPPSRFTTVALPHHHYEATRKSQQNRSNQVGDDIVVAEKPRKHENHPKLLCHDAEANIVTLRSLNTGWHRRSLLWFVFVFRSSYKWGKGSKNGLDLVRNNSVLLRSRAIMTCAMSPLIVVRCDERKKREKGERWRERRKGWKLIRVWWMEVT